MSQTPEEKREYAAKWRQKNRDKIRAYAKSYYWSSSETKNKSNAASKSWYDRNAKKVLERTSNYSENNKEKRTGWKSYSIQSQLYYSAKSRAKHLGLPFNIVKEDIIVPSCCPILGVKFTKEKGPTRSLNPSLDRLIPEKGYVKGNIAVISLKANMLKNDMSLETARKLVSYLELYTH